MGSHFLLFLCPQSPKHSWNSKRYILIIPGIPGGFDIISGVCNPNQKKLNWDIIEADVPHVPPMPSYPFCEKKSLAIPEGMRVLQVKGPDEGVIMLFVVIL